jgi:hypothetical protein
MWEMIPEFFYESAMTGQDVNQKKFLDYVSNMYKHLNNTQKNRFKVYIRKHLSCAIPKDLYKEVLRIIRES